jgi:hypothetical protein
MSAWKIAIRRLHALGGVATTMQITEDIEAKASRYWPVERLRELGLIEPAERNGNRTVCRITPLGVALHFRTGRRPEVVRMLEEAQ